MGDNVTGGHTLTSVRQRLEEIEVQRTELHREEQVLKAQLKQLRREQLTLWIVHVRWVFVNNGQVMEKTYPVYAKDEQSAKAVVQLYLDVTLDSANPNTGEMSSDISSYPIREWTVGVESMESFLSRALDQH